MKAIWNKKTQRISLHFAYSVAMVAKISTLRGRKFQSKPTPHWEVEHSQSTLKQLRAWGFSMGSPELQDFSHLPKYPSVKKIGRQLRFNTPHELEEFQKYGVAFIESRGGRAVLADQMRVGKSVQSLGWIAECSRKTTLVLCPATIKETWRREILKWIPDATVYVVHGYYDKDYTLPSAEFYIVNYDIIAVKKRVDGHDKIVFRNDILEKNPKNLIIDECHHVNNMTAQRTKAIRRLKRRIPNIIPMSGTPLDKPVQFFVALNLVAPKLFPSYKDYVERYCDPKRGKDGKMDYSGASHIEELHHILKSTVLLRRTRKEVLPNLPEVKPVIVVLPLSNRNNYDLAQQGIVKELNYAFGDKEWGVNTKSKNILEKLKQVVAAEKLEACIEWIKNTLEQEEKLVVFANHTGIIDMLNALCKYNPVVVDGRTPQAKRQACRDKFTEDKDCRVFIGNTKACKEGLDLSVADVSCTIELSWSPNDHDQSGDRIVHIHKKNAKLLSYFLIAEDTIEEIIMRILDRKRKVISKLMDGKTVEDEKLLGALLQHLRKYNK